MEPGGWLRWREAMQKALYGPEGFYVRPDAPAQNFRTSAHVGPTWSRLIADLAHRVDAALDHPDRFSVVEVGAGGGELLATLAEVGPEHWSLIGVDVAPRPTDLPDRVDWRTTAPAATTGLVVAVEWLDVVPVDVVEVTDGGPRYVEVRTDGSERSGGRLDDADQAWLNRWWPMQEWGERREVGRTRDAAWAATTDGLSAGLALMVDYAVDPLRDRGGTLTGYGDGWQTAPVPDGQRDLTAHVLVDSLVVPGDLVLPQREALRRLGLSTDRAAYDGDPARFLETMNASGEAAELLDQFGLGGFTWLLHGRGVDPVALLEGE